MKQLKSDCEHFNVRTAIAHIRYYIGIAQPEKLDDDTFINAWLDVWFCRKTEQLSNKE